MIHDKWRHAMYLSVFLSERLWSEDDNFRVAVKGDFWFSFLSSLMPSSESSIRKDSMCLTSCIDSVISYYGFWLWSSILIFMIVSLRSWLVSKDLWHLTTWKSDQDRGRKIIGKRSRSSMITKLQTIVRPRSWSLFHDVTLGAKDLCLLIPVIRHYFNDPNSRMGDLRSWR